MPERVEYRLLLQLATGRVKYMRVTIGKVVNVLDFVIVTQGGSNESSKLVRQYQTFRASTVVCAHYQNLFWVVPHK